MRESGDRARCRPHSRCRFRCSLAGVSLSSSPAMRTSHWSRHALPLATLLYVGTLPGQATQQANRSSSAAVYFTAEDALDVVTYSVADLSDDGQWLAVTASLRRDGYGTDYRRDGDPTYVHGVPVRMLVMDLRTGATRPVFADKRAVRGARWAPDGRRLAMLMLNGDVFEPVVWDRVSGKTTTLHVPADRYVAEASDIRWTADGKQVVVATHTNAWRKTARAQFAAITTGPVFVQSSLDPFLAWDDLRRMGGVRAVVAIDVQSGQARDLLPETMIGTYTLAEDASAISYGLDIAKKTDYDSFGSETSLLTRPLGGGSPKTLLPTTKGVQVAWAEDGKHYAYSKDGRVYVTSIDGGEAKQVAGVPELKRGETPDT